MGNNRIDIFIIMEWKICVLPVFFIFMMKKQFDQNKDKGSLHCIHTDTFC